jgi:hypothetical protein
MAFSTSPIVAAWRHREAELRHIQEQQLQPHNDSLFEVLRESILSRRDEIHAQLLTAAATAHHVRDIQATLWTYRASYFPLPYDTLPRERVQAAENELRVQGHQWLIGLTAVYPSGASEFLLHDDLAGRPWGGPSAEEWEASWRARSPRPVHDVIRHTDVMSRIALLFGDRHYRVSYRVVSEVLHPGPLDAMCETVELVLNYHPKGVYGSVLQDQQAAAVKYAAHVSTVPEWGHPTVWVGAPPIRRSLGEGLQESDLDGCDIDGCEICDEGESYRSCGVSL